MILLGNLNDIKPLSLHKWEFTLCLQPPTYKVIEELDLDPCWLDDISSIWLTPVQILNNYMWWI